MRSLLLAFYEWNITLNICSRFHSHFVWASENSNLTSYFSIELFIQNLIEFIFKFIWLLYLSITIFTDDVVANPFIKYEMRKNFHLIEIINIFQLNLFYLIFLRLIVANDDRKSNPRQEWCWWLWGLYGWVKTISVSVETLNF